MQVAKELKRKFDRICDSNMLWEFSRTHSFRKMVNESDITFTDIIDKYQKIENNDNISSLFLLLEQSEDFAQFFKDNRISKKDVEYLLSKIEEELETNPAIVCSLCKNPTLLKYCFDNEILNVERITRFDHKLKPKTFFDILQMYNDHEEIFKMCCSQRRIFENTKVC